MLRRALFLVVAFALVPAASNASPARCESPCEITTVAYGYIAPVTEIAAGSDVLWVTTDEGHPTSDSFDTEEQCFLVQVAASVEPIPVSFEIDGDGVTATESPGSSGAVAKRCLGAVATTGGAYALQYRCLVHGFMNGVLLIEP